MTATCLSEGLSQCRQQRKCHDRQQGEAAERVQMAAEGNHDGTSVATDPLANLSTGATTTLE